MRHVKKERFAEKTISSKRIYKGRIIGLREDKVLLPNGVKSKREIVEHPGAVAVIAIAKDNKIILVRQYRKAVEEAIFEIPAGLVHWEKGETALQAAKRELEEETGYRARKIKKLLKGFASPGYSSEIIHYFLATDLIQTKPNPDEDELLEPVLVNPKDYKKLIKSGKIKDNKTLLGILLALNSPPNKRV